MTWKRRSGFGGVKLGLSTVLAATFLPFAVLHAQVSTPTFRFAIPAGSLQQALTHFASVTGEQLFYSADMVAGRQAQRLIGTFPEQAALGRLLAGSGLTARRAGPHVIILKPVATSVAGSGDPGDQGDVPAVPLLSTRVLPAIMGGPGKPEPGASEFADPAPLASSDIVVTGTHIRGQNPGSPPVTTISRIDMDHNGYATVAQALQALPGNFGGEATEQSTLASADKTGNNAGFATGINLRGLGAGATLVLVNGQRLAGSGAMGAFGDVTAIPAGAVDRVEVLLDGASAIYGSDAVGGVVNILLKRPFNGAESSVRFGSVTSGGKRDITLDQTVGHEWRTGGILLSYDFSRTGRLASADRAFARSADSQPFGGTDHRYPYSLPGNIFGFDPATSGFAPLYAIPPGQDGTALTPGSFLSGQTNLENFREGVDLIPRQIRHSVYGRLVQDLGDHVHLSVDGRYSHRAFDASSLGSIAIFDVTNANPYYVSPTGALAELIGYSLGQEVGPSDVHGFAEAMAYSVGLDADIGGHWKLRSYAAFSQEREVDHTDHLANSASISEALGTTPDDPTTPFSTAVDGYFNPFGSGHSNSSTILDFIGNGYELDWTRTQTITGHVDADGTLLELPGGAVKLALGGDVRQENFRKGGAELISTARPVDKALVDGGRLVEAVFAEVRVPLFGPDNGRSGVRRLELSLAGRVEHYADFGTTANPRLGLSWVPLDGITLRSSYGTSFRAPNLRELNDAERVSATTLTRADGVTIPVIELSGGNPDLKPETARNWTAGIDFQPVIVPGLTLDATWFQTRFSRRIGSPANENFPDALIDPTLSSFVELVSASTNAADLARVTALLTDPKLSSESSFPASSIGAIVDARYVNTGRIDVSGIDLTVRYSFPIGADRIDLSANGSYLLRYREQVTPTAPSIDERNQVDEPVDLRGRLSAAWTHGPFNALVGMNYVDRYHDLVGNRIRSWKTFDLQVGYANPTKQGWLAGFELSLVAQNLFDKAPPFYDSPIGAGYDAANSDALGRFVSLQLTKHW